MTIRHIRNHPERYTITSDYGGERRLRRWSLYLDDLEVQASAEVSWLRDGVGWGFQFGRNGSESDVGLDIHAGRLTSLYLRLRSPWTKWARVEKSGPTDRTWHYVRHTGIRIHGWQGNWVHIQIEKLDGVFSRDDPWWREIRIGKTQVMGRTATTRTVVDEGETAVPMPEGVYDATWRKTLFETRYVRWPFRLLPAKTHTSYWLNVEGGIPYWGKGENSWDCGMDGLMGTSGCSVAEAVGNAVKSVTRSRDRHGPRERLPRPMTISEAEAHFTEASS